MHLILWSFSTCTLLCGLVNLQAHNPYNYFTNNQRPQADGFIFPDSFNRPTQAPQSSIIRGNAQYNSNERISLQKCKDYSKLVSKTVTVGTLSYGSRPYSYNRDECEFSQGLIIGGVDAKAGEFPHMAAIGAVENDEIRFSCGGSLISERFVLTAAHCRVGRPTFVRLGDHNLKVKENALPEIDYSIERFIYHENYNSRTKENDIAVIKLRNNVVFSKYIRPACLMQLDNQIQNRKGIATGWGLTESSNFDSASDRLKKVEINFVDTRRCSAFYKDEGFSIGNTQLCAGEDGKDTCRGDSGGPLQVTSENSKCVYVIAGVTSFGNEDCGASVFGVYTKVSAYLDWIEKNVWG